MLCMVGVPRGASAGEPFWLDGAALQQRLEQPVSRSIDGAPLRRTLYRLGREQQIGILLDRRVDPDQKLSLRVQEATLWGLFQQIAQEVHLGVTRLDGVCYFGPPSAAARLRTLAELRAQEVRGLGRSVSARFLRNGPLRWEDLATPREILEQLAAENQLKLVGLDQVPHDLWAAAELPPLSLVDRLTLLAVQFDLTFQVAATGDTVTLVPIPAEVVVTRSYPGARQATQLADRWGTMIPDAKIQVSGDRVVVTGLLEDHERISGKSQPSSRAKPAGGGAAAGQQRHTVRKAEGPLGSLIQGLAKGLDLEVRYDEEALRRAGISLQKPVQFSVTDATVDEVFAALLDQTGCRFRREGRVIYIEPAPRP